MTVMDYNTLNKKYLESNNTALHTLHHIKEQQLISRRNRKTRKSLFPTNFIIDSDKTYQIKLITIE